MTETKNLSTPSTGVWTNEVMEVRRRCMGALFGLGLIVAGGVGDRCLAAGGVEALVTEAIEAGKAGRHSLAIGSLEEAVGLDPGDLQVRILLGNAYYQDFQVEKAIGQWALVLKRNPENKQARGWLERVRHEWSEPGKRLGLARALAKEKMFQQAVSILVELAKDEEAKELRQEILVEQAEALIEIGIAGEEEKKNAAGTQVIHLAQRAIAEFPDNRETGKALLVIGRAYQHLISDYREAARIYQELLGTQPEAEIAAMAKTEKAWCACRLGDVNGGRLQLESFIRDNPQSAQLPEAQNYLASLHLDLAGAIVPAREAVPVVKQGWKVIQSITTSEEAQVKRLRENATRAAELFDTGEAYDDASAVYTWLASHAANDPAETARYSLEAGRILIRAERATAEKRAHLHELDLVLTDRGKRGLDLLDGLIANSPGVRREAAREILDFASWFESMERANLAREVFARVITKHEGLDVVREARFEMGLAWLKEGKQKPVTDSVLPDEITRGLAEFEKLLPLVKDDPLLKKVTGEVERLSMHLEASSRKLAYAQIRWILTNVPDVQDRKQLALRSVDLARKLADEEINDLKSQQNPEALKQLNDWHRKGAVTLAMVAGEARIPKEAQPILKRFESWVDYYKSLQAWKACDELIGILAAGAGDLKNEGLRLQAEVSFHKGEIFYSELKEKGGEADRRQLAAEMLVAIKTDAQRLKMSADPMVTGIVETIAGFYRSRNLTHLAVEAYLAAAAQNVSVDFDADKILKAARVLLDEGRRRHQEEMQATKGAENWSGPELKRGLELIVRLKADYPDAEVLKVAASEYTSLAHHYRSCRGWNKAVEILEARKDTFPDFDDTAAVEMLIADNKVESAQSEYSRQEALKRGQRKADDGRIPEGLSVALDNYLALRKAYPDSEQARASVARIMGMAYFFAKRQEWKKAVSVLEGFMASEPKYARADQFYYQMGLCHMGIFDAEAHITALAESMQGDLDELEHLIAAVDETRRLRLSELGYVPVYMRDAMPHVVAEGGAIAGKLLAKNEEQTGSGERIRKNDRDTGAGRRREDDPAPRPAGTLSPEPGDKPGIPATVAAPKEVDEKMPTLPNGQLAQVALQTDFQGAGDIQYVQGITSKLELSDEQADLAYGAFRKVLKDYPESPLRQLATREVMVIAQSYLKRQLAEKAARIYERLAKDLPRLESIEDVHLEIARSRVKAGEQVTDTDKEVFRSKVDEWFEKARQGFSAFMQRFPESRCLEKARAEMIDTYVNQARALMKDHRDGSVRALLEGRGALLGALVKDPKRGEAFQAQLAGFASLFEELGSWADAIDTYNLHLKHFPAGPSATAYKKRSAEIRETQLKQHARAVTDYLEYIQQFQPADAEEIRSRIYSLAERLKGQKRFAEAIEIYKQYVSNFPNDSRAAECWYNIGSMYFDNNLWEEAVESFEELIAEYPGSPQMLPAHLEIARCYSCLSRWADARTQNEEYLKKGGKTSAEITASVLALRKLEKFQDFIDTYKEHRKRPDAQFALTEIIQSDLQLSYKSILEYQKVINEYPDSYHADDSLFAIAQQYLVRGEMEEAREAVRRLVEKYPESPLADDALYLAGESYEKEAEALRKTTVEQVEEQQIEITQRDAIRRIADQNRGNRLRVSDNLKDLNSTVNLGREARELSQFNYQVNKDQQMWLWNGNTLFQAQQESTKLTAFERRNIQDQVNARLRSAVETYREVASLYRTRDKAAESLQRVVKIYSDEIKDKKKWVEVVQMLVKHHPSSKISEGPSFEIGRYYQRDGKHAEAIQAYNQFLYNFPKSDRITDARFLIAECQEQLGKWINAIDAYQDFINRYPTHAMAKRARDRINWIKAYHL